MDKNSFSKLENNKTSKQSKTSTKPHEQALRQEHQVFTIRAQRLTGPKPSTGHKKDDRKVGGAVPKETAFLLSEVEESSPLVLF